MMEFYLLNEQLDIIDIIDTFESAIWTSKYYESGDFELYLSASSKMISLMRENNYLVRTDDIEHAMIIKNIQITTDVENGDHILVTGSCLKSILKRRIIWNQTTINGNVETCIRQLVNENIISSSIEERNVDNLILGEEIGLTATMQAQYTGDNLGETIEAICKSYQIGYDILLNLTEKTFMFILYQGCNRSYNQKENQHVTFSPSFDNLLSTTYTYNSENYKNVAKIAGEGEGNARKTTTIGTAIGLNRYEIFVDAKDISTNDGEITDSDYNKLLIEKGMESLAETTSTESLDGDVESGFNYIFGEHYYLGDIVEVVNEYGISMTPRIISVTQSKDANGTYTIPTFSTE